MLQNSIPRDNPKQIPFLISQKSESFSSQNYLSEKMLFFFFKDCEKENQVKGAN